MTIKTIREVLAETIAAEMRTDPDVFLMGEDVSGGAGCDGRGRGEDGSELDEGTDGGDADPAPGVLQEDQACGQALCPVVFPEEEAAVEARGYGYEQQWLYVVGRVVVCSAHPRRQSEGA